MKLVLFNKNNPFDVFIDKEDFERVSKYKWRVSTNGYVVLAKKGTLYLHRFILKAKIGSIVDHINLNKLDNRKQNLRFVNKKYNETNKLKTKIKTSSKYKGVHFENYTQKYRAAVKCNGKIYRLGRFNNEIDAAKAYNKKALELFGKFVRLNNV